MEMIASNLLVPAKRAEEETREIRIERENAILKADLARLNSKHMQLMKRAAQAEQQNRFYRKERQQAYNQILSGQSRHCSESAARVLIGTVSFCGGMLLTMAGTILVLVL